MSDEPQTTREHLAYYGICALLIAGMMCVFVGFFALLKWCWDAVGGMV